MINPLKSLIEIELINKLGGVFKLSWRYRLEYGLTFLYMHFQVIAQQTMAVFCSGKSQTKLKVCFLV